MFARVLNPLSIGPHSCGPAFLPMAVMVSPSATTKTSPAESEGDYRTAAVVVGCRCVRIAIVVRRGNIAVASMIWAVISITSMPIYTLMPPMPTMRAEIGGLA